MKTTTKKAPYEEPLVEVIHFQTSGSVLTASNDGYTITPFDPDFNS